METPETRYVKTVDGVSIAYQVLGAGSPSIVFAPSAWASNVEIVWDWPVTAPVYGGLAARGTVVVFDRRGTGLSDKVSGERLPTLDAKMDDIRAVTDAVGFDRAVLYGQEDGAAACLLFAATYPERTQAVITAGATASGLPSQDRPWAWTDEQWDDEIRSVDETWGTRAYAVGLTQEIFPSRLTDDAFINQYSRVLRHSMSRADAIAACRIWRDTDVRGVLPLVQAPTLVMHYSQDQDEPVDEGRYIADRIPGAVFAELPGVDRGYGDFSAIDPFLVRCANPNDSQRPIR